MAPLVSLIMPARSPDPGWLAEAVDAALGQTDCRVELVVVDDGSPMPVADLLTAGARSRLAAVRVEAGGVGAARDAGFEACAGTHVRFIDADDVIPPNSTARLLELAQGRDDRIACGATRWCDAALTPAFDWKAGCGRDHVRRCLLLRSMPMLPSLLFPRTIVERVGGWDHEMTVCEDWDFILRAFELAPVAETRQAVTLYRRYEGSASTDREASFRGMERTIARFWDRHPHLRETRLRGQVETMLELQRAELSPRGQRPRLRYAALRAVRRDPAAALTIHRRFVHPVMQTWRTRVRKSLYRQGAGLPTNR